ncbi:MAG: bifunctional 5,10-methylene-tetrahydrofolate dehydrogenase/5,10-methylene-tetrahydrofolate cyclohydrolase [Lachnospiraceae bacterium]|nr:bifunctional 5,10-methylene-tetrahydrofolate dehydrogenase/5,10-methylene-tetrahydrofolate cyclohydrolase [Lachnospiraceae bacterium]
MAERLSGAPVAKALDKETKERADSLAEKGIQPTLAVLRVGENDADISYEKNIIKKASKNGIAVKQVILPENVENDAFFEVLDSLNQDAAVHGILMFRPLPAHLDGERARTGIAAEKDVDGCSDLSLAGVFIGKELGFAPCTAQAVIELLDFYNIDLKGKDVCLAGRSLVVGKPLSSLCTNRHATVDLCHSRTTDLPGHARRSDILITAIGRAGFFTADYVDPEKGQIVIDVGMNTDEEGKLCGDAVYDELEPLVKAITPVPGGVGSVTTAVLMRHVVEACERTTR